MRFFVTEDRISGDLIDLEPSDAQHVSRVLRMAVGEEITVCCGNGRLSHMIVFTYILEFYVTHIGILSSCLL